MNLVAHDIVIRPIVTEKSSSLMGHNKIQIRQAVEQIFKVKVLSVNTINVKGKPKRMGAFVGKTRSWKKAIVALPEGQRIEFFEGASV